MVNKRPRAPIEEKLRRNGVAQGECIVWGRAIHGSGYAITSHEGEKWSVHRLAWTLAHGEIPPGMDIDHMCHVRHCFNIEHLRLATRSQNCQNPKAAEGRGASGVRGVRFHEKRGSYSVRVIKDGITHGSSPYQTLEDAESAARSLRLLLFTHNEVDKRLAGQ